MFAAAGRGEDTGTVAVHSRPLTAQYTKIEAFVYSHYPTWYPDYGCAWTLLYTQARRESRLHLPPNSMEFLVKLMVTPAPDWRVAMRVRFVRHV
jgi:hypothetical protein